MDALGDFRETRAFMISVRDHFSRVLAHLQAIECEVTDTAGHMPECYSDADFHRFVTLRMGILSVKSKVVWCDETIESIDRRLGVAHSTTNRTLLSLSPLIDKRLKPGRTAVDDPGTLPPPLAAHRHRVCWQCSNQGAALVATSTRQRSCSSVILVIPLEAFV